MSFLERSPIPIQYLYCAIHQPVDFPIDLLVGGVAEQFLELSKKQLDS